MIRIYAIKQGLKQQIYTSDKEVHTFKQQLYIVES